MANILAQQLNFAFLSFSYLCFSLPFLLPLLYSCCLYRLLLYIACALFLLTSTIALVLASLAEGAKRLWQYPL
jgi:hypothetical protein